MKRQLRRKDPLQVKSEDYKELAANIIEQILTSDIDQTNTLAEILASVYYEGLNTKIGE